jgi:outer membrane protein assembly factor BamB
LDSGQNIPYLFDEQGNVVNNSLGQPAGAFTDQVVKIPGQQHFDAVGQIIAVDAETGDIEWRRPVNNQPGEFGMGVWSTAAIDEDEGFGYIGTGQAYNPPASANACAILKFDLATGAIVHTYSVKPTPLTRMESCVFSAEYPGGDPAIPTANDPTGNERDAAYYSEIEVDGNFYGDNDVGSGPILYKTKVNGVNTKVVAAISKAGRIRAFNRTTDNMIWERVITSTSGSNFASPGLAYDDGVVYAASINDVTANNRRAFNANNGLATLMDQIAILIGPVLLNSTQISALDDANGQSLWAQDPIVAGHTLTAPSISKNVLYHISFDSTVRAFDTSTGVQLSTAEPLGPTAELFSLPCLPPATCALFPLNSIHGNSVTFMQNSLFVPAGIELLGPGVPDGGVYKYSVDGK